MDFFPQGHPNPSIRDTRYPDVRISETSQVVVRSEMMCVVSQTLAHLGPFSTSKTIAILKSTEKLKLHQMNRVVDDGKWDALMEIQYFDIVLITN